MRWQKEIAFIAIIFSSIGSAFAEKNPKTYRNPIIADRTLADPDVIKVDNTYYLYATSSGRGYEVFVSTNLVDWKNKGWAFRDQRGGAWAPDVFYNSTTRGGDGKLYLYYTDSASGGEWDNHKEIGVAVGKSPLGPFADKG